MYASVNCDTGMVLTVRIVWPEFGDEVLQQLIRDDADESVLWRVDVFPNFVTYRRQIEALKTVCIRGYLEPKPTDIVQRILASLIGDQVERREAECGTLETESAGRRRDESDGDEPEVAIPAAADIQPRPSATNVNTVSSNFVLPSDVVTDEAPPDEELSPGLPSAGKIDDHQQLRQKPLSHSVCLKEDLFGFLTPKRQDHPSYRRIRSSKHLNESQLKAVEAAVNEPLTIIQGPPGTGKTKTAAAIVKEWLSVDTSSTVIIEQFIFR